MFKNLVKKVDASEIVTNVVEATKEEIKKHQKEIEDMAARIGTAIINNLLERNKKSK